eukprot:TRINITY_DN9609_c0_g1_i1.p1 TRINITY_DN9609_c0_g1~~TRINITY_DN9609_c0_g1_i1.p1  ORF type:complete len:556 (+),score=135.56 TRINITY_DN9609_c0_g1_i1:33-1700(+)
MRFLLALLLISLLIAQSSPSPARVNPPKVPSRPSSALFEFASDLNSLIDDLTSSQHLSNLFHRINPHKSLISNPGYNAFHSAFVQRDVGFEDDTDSIQDNPARILNRDRLGPSVPIQNKGDGSHLLKRDEPTTRNFYFPNFCNVIGRPIRSTTITKNYCSSGCIATEFDCSSGICTIQAIRCGDREYVLIDALPLSMKCGENIVTDVGESNLGNCSVLKVEVSGYVLDFTPSENLKCTIDTVVCDGKVVVDPHSVTPTDNCQITTRSCNINEPCTSIKKECNEEGCYFKEMNCDDPCFEKTCECPIDRLGSSCSEQRGFSCSTKRTKPSACPSKSVSGHQTCPGYTLGDIIDFSYLINCKFIDNVPKIGDREHEQFTYWAKFTSDTSTTFAISSRRHANYTSPPPSGWTFSNRAINFVQFSDSRGTQDVPLTPGQTMGKAPVQFKVDSAELYGASDNLFLAGRLYFENKISVGEYRLGGQHDQINAIDRIAINFDNIPPPLLKFEPWTSFQIFCIISAAILGGFIVFSTIQSILKSRKKAQKRLEKDLKYTGVSM